MYSGYDYLLSLKILFVYFLALSSLLPPSILFNCFYTCFCSFLLHECNYSKYRYRWERKKERLTNGYFIEYLVLAYTIELMDDLGLVR